MFIHEKLICYQKSIWVLKEINESLCKSMPRGNSFLSDQLRRAMISAILNLSEGNAKKSKADRKRFFDISLGSISEVSSCLDILTSISLLSVSKNFSLKSELKTIYSMIFKLS